MTFIGNLIAKTKIRTFTGKLIIKDYKVINIHSNILRKTTPNEQ